MERRTSHAGIPLHTVIDPETGLNIHAHDADPAMATREPSPAKNLSPAALRIIAGNKGINTELPHGAVKTAKMKPPKSAKLMNSIKATVADLLEGMPPVDEDTLTGNVAVIPLPMGRGHDLRKEPCPCGSGKPKDECDCNKQTTTMNRMTNIMGGNEPIKGNRLRKIATIAGGL